MCVCSDKCVRWLLNDTQSTTWAELLYKSYIGFSAASATKLRRSLRSATKRSSIVTRYGVAVLFSPRCVIVWRALLVTVNVG